MTKRTIALFGVMCAVLMLGACFSVPPSTPIVFDENVPPEESVTIYFQYMVSVTSYNGIPVPTTNAPLTYFRKKSEWYVCNVVLPAGEIEFVMDAFEEHFERGTNVINVYRNITLTYTFEPGKGYSIYFGPLKEGVINKETQWGFRIYHDGDYDALPLSGSEGEGIVLQ